MWNDRFEGGHNAAIGVYLPATPKDSLTKLFNIRFSSSDTLKGKPPFCIWLVSFEEHSFTSIGEKSVVNSK